MSNEERPPPGPHTCERCFDKATVYVRDSRCVGWGSATEGCGPYWLRYEPDGEFRFFCAKHKRKPRVFNRDEVLKAFADEHPERVIALDDATATELKRQRLAPG